MLICRRCVTRRQNGRAVLEWKEQSRHAELTDDDDDDATTWADLDVSALSLEDEPHGRGAAGFNPYDRGAT